MILVDSTVYIDWLRSRVDPSARLGDALRRNEAVTCGIIRAEVLRGIVSPPAKERMAMLFTLMQEVALDGDLWTDTAEMAWSLGRQGIVLPLTDIAIAACSRRVGATLITTDRHFGMIPGLRIRASI